MCICNSHCSIGTLVLRIACTSPTHSPRVRRAGGIYRQLVQRQLQGGLSLTNLPSIAENGHGRPKDDAAAADDSARSDTDDETLYVH
jgi:hypothetical protein